VQGRFHSSLSHHSAFPCSRYHLSNPSLQLILSLGTVATRTTSPNDFGTALRAHVHASTYHRRCNSRFLSLHTRSGVSSLLQQLMVVLSYYLLISTSRSIVLGPANVRRVPTIWPSDTAGRHEHPQDSFGVTSRVPMSRILVDDACFVQPHSRSAWHGCGRTSQPCIRHICSLRHNMY
jgi:hypothetical protein